MIDLPEHLDDTGIVDARNEVREEGWLLLKVERECFIVAISRV